MAKDIGDSSSQLSGGLGSFLRKCLFSILSVGPLPNHIAFIMDGNRRYAKKHNMAEGAGHKAGYLALMKMLCYCYELGVKYATVYAFSIDNFKRRPEEVQSLMNLMLEKIEELLREESIVNQYGIRIYFIGNLNLLSEPVRVAAEKAMAATATNTKTVLLICVAYTSYDEILHAVQESCKIKRNEIEERNVSKVSNGVTEGAEEVDEIHGVIMHNVQGYCENSSNKFQVLNTSRVCDSVTRDEKKNEVVVNAVGGSCKIKWDEAASRACNVLIEGVEESMKKQWVLPPIKLLDVEKHMYMSVAPEPDILIRTSGETRLSNFLLWQTTNCPLYSPTALWPEIGLWHLVWAVLNFQRSYQYFEKKKKQL
ncbi:dehydrodolichyl diphosphate synthase CPT3-like [Carya illinoinensis]|nr:dehydrodolichyl diphosphate synthase CPT3-like [Carya illinoinensis]XP_042990701.1 dehydrodolichyl diphosphate synthase CPT3-like [Carya illinoinensis]XP_042990702.1 dehydrodolichyl diphosphate synthase CPT3-like [Carya illinoinensis]XP_042990703.1 dehydrodolichyl diphosphate synthase CPT3-like [Carya illinoinensis]XP_042990704.1 dehydrodolichyl diphosphate synthase CPT3-like [Carya illinoinensis]XP_042990705.1 dehydrodolichyl diphosphate synthase CPT3-like [Carya illinoinensis]XP_04299070